LAAALDPWRVQASMDPSGISSWALFHQNLINASCDTTTQIL
jgi:hypothetical protein